MTKTITQETFNEVVSENIDEFAMTEEEAVEDAILQFQAQGVNLSSIMTNSRKATKITELVKQINNLVEQNCLSDENISAVLCELSELLKDEISAKLLAAQKGVYPLLVQCIRKGDENLIISTLKTLSTLMDGYPDLLDEEGVSLVLRHIDSSRKPEEVTQALNWLAVCVTKQESSRSALIKGGVAIKLQKLAAIPKPEKSIVVGVCTAVQVLVSDDDVRVVHGNAHEHARALAPELLPQLSRLLHEMVEEPAVTSNILQAIATLLVRNEFCVMFHDGEGLKYVFDAMLEHSENENVVRHCMLLLKCLAGSDEVREPIIASGGAPLIVGALEKHYKCGGLAIAGCMCIAALSLRSPANSLALVSAGVAETLLRCMTHWKKNKAIVKSGCLAIRNQLCRNPELKSEYLELQVEPLLREVRNLHGDLEFEAKSVLVDLGCDVQLREEWRGRGVQLTN